ncbi:MAG: hypothetical protein METHAR1v1_880016 [Methanothrix sp.]|nr:MAG: hypothetical protein METHAR1v1_880016 [Methanothrix sp.]
MNGPVKTTYLGMIGLIEVTSSGKVWPKENDISLIKKYI